MQNTDLEDFTQRIEHMLLFQLTLNLKHGKLSVEDAQKIAKAYLSFKPNSKEELLESLITLGRTYIVIEPVVAAFSKEYDKEFKEKVLSQMKNNLDQGNIDAAVQAGKQGGLQ